MCVKMNTAPNKYIFLLCLTTLVFLFPNLLHAGDTTVWTPEGRPVPADTPPEMSDTDIAWCHWYIQYYYIDNPPYLNAVRIGNASNTYNCHGYAWSLSEGGEQVWIGTDEDPDVEIYYWTDGAWSNDGQPSYLTASESEATHAWYNPGDHSVRKIQNSYPRPIDGARDYVSKWGYFGLYQHQKGHDIYRLKSTTGFDFKKLKTAHSGTLSSYPKTWVGAGGKTHSLSADVYVPSGVTLTVKQNATVNLSRYKVASTGGTIVRQGGTTFNPDIRLMSGSTILGQYPTFQQAWDNVASGQSVYLDSDTYTGDIDMKPNVGLYGKGEDYTTINGRVNFNGDDYASLEAVQVNQKILVTSSDYVYIAIKAGSADCYLDIYGSWADASMTSTVSRNQGIYAHHYSDLGFWGLEMRNKSWGVDLYLSTDAVIEGVYFCQNNYDINADPGCSADAWSCNFSSSEEGGSVLGNVSWDVWDWCGMQKRAVTNANAASSGNKNVALHSTDSSPTEYREAMNIYQTIKRNLRQDRLTGALVNPQKYAAEFAAAVEKFKQVVANYPGSADAISSLGRIATSYRALNDFKPLENYMQTIANDTELSHLRPYALSALIPSHIKQKNYLKAIDLSDQIIKEFPEDPIVCELLYGKGLIYKYF
ncbi:MAG: tetratricopeptide repeat protein, partial [candidate division KSB1 bacterium]|nr:tetratricopeptide repeat protein [candidate division KSB1 bacterium]